MKKLKRHLTLLLVFILTITMINFKFTKPVYASGISATPSRIETKEDQKVYVDTGGLLCYVRYTATQDRPSIDQMWRIPQGNNYQDFNVPGEWYLHVYVPSTGEWGCFGPYKRDAMPPDVPRYKNPAEGKWVRSSSVSYDVYCLGDLEDHGYDAINDLWTSWPSGFWRMEGWENDSVAPCSDYQAYITNTETEEGWYVKWYRSVDKIYNYSEWTKTEFGIDVTAPTLTPNPTVTNNGVIIITANNMEDHGLSGNKQLTFNAWKDGGQKVTKVQQITEEGANASPQMFTYSELGGSSKDIYHIEVITEDQVGNTRTYPITVEGTNVSAGDPTSSNPDDPLEPDDPDYTDPDPEPSITESSKGSIKFNPNETIWTNEGKISESEGAYPVEVYYEGDNPFIKKGTAIIERVSKNGKVHTSRKSIKLEFPLEGIEVSDATDEYVDGDRGTVNIEQEGYQLHLHGEGIWGYPDYEEPDDCVDVEYENPPTPVGDSKYYNLDWTKPVIKFSMDGKQIFSTQNGAIRKPSTLGIDDGFYGKLSVSDNLSGVKFIEYKWTYGNKKPSSGYTRIYESQSTNTDRSSEVIEKEVEKPVGDNLYLHIRAGDVAGDNGQVGDKNIQYECFGPFEDPIKLKDFQITDIRDPRWKDVFWEDDYETYKDVTYKVDRLPIDEESHPTIRNALPKKGYAFYFDITSEYLYREKDRIEIRPTFYYLDGTNRIRADAYYNNNNNPFVKFGTDLDDSALYKSTDKYGDVLIGGYNKLTLTKGVRICKGREWIDGWKDEIQYKDGKIQWWYGKYYIPSSTVFVKAGDKPRPENILTGGDILINFEIIAYKNGVETLSLSQIFNYTAKQWNIEGGPKTSSQYNYYKGDTIIYNGHRNYGVNSDKNIEVIH